MISNIRRKIIKNAPEAQSFLMGKMPDFVYGRHAFTDIPIFCFHSAQFPHFEKQLLFLRVNRYRTLTCDQLYERLIDPNYRNDGKEIVVTFDDGMSSVWSVAFPLLQKYEFNIVSFIIPGVIGESTNLGATINDVEVSERLAVAKRDYSDNPLCNWREIQEMHESGLVDFQSHGMCHALISTGPTIVDFVHPDFDTYHYANIHVPIYSDGRRDGLRDDILGHPIYENDSRFSTKLRYYDAAEVRNACANYVQERGGHQFFKNRQWRKELLNVAKTASASCLSNHSKYETIVSQKEQITTELYESKQYIQKYLRKDVRHFCFPWFKASELSARLAFECGYQSIFLGATEGFKRNRNRDYPQTVTRLQEEYLLALPGRGRHKLLDVWLGKLRRRKNNSS